MLPWASTLEGTADRLVQFREEHGACHLQLVPFSPHSLSHEPCGSSRVWTSKSDRWQTRIKALGGSLIRLMNRHTRFFSENFLFLSSYKIFRDLLSTFPLPSPPNDGREPWLSKQQKNQKSSPSVPLNLFNQTLPPASQCLLFTLLKLSILREANGFLLLCPLKRLKWRWYKDLPELGCLR